MRIGVLTALLTSSVSLLGCASPFAQPTGMNWSGAKGTGTIAVSDPKMYRREALINERNREVVWLDDLLEKSKSVEFKPEIVREIEQITALSAALGLSFDPAAGLNYRRSKETGDIQQEISAVKLQLQLDQLKRDAALVRAGLDAQTVPLNGDIAKLGGDQVPTANAGTSAATAEQLKAAIDRLTSNLTNRLDADGKPAAISNATANPADVFRDRAAYRDILKTARNAASLDELHDLGGAALIRLNFQATVLPDRAHSNVPGIVQMKVLGPRLTERDRQQLYRGWLDYVNDRMNVERGAGWRPNDDLIRSAVVDNFDIVEFRYAPPPSAATGNPAGGTIKSKAAGRAKVAAPAPPPPSCGGLVIDPTAAAPSGCASLLFAVPKFLGMSPQEGAHSDLSKYLAAFHLDVPDDVEANEYSEARTTLAKRPADLITGCGLPHPAKAGVVDPDPIDDLYSALELSRIRIAGGGVLSAIDRQARRMLEARQITPPSDERMSTVAIRTARAQMLISSLERFAYVDCSPQQREAFRASGSTLSIPTGFSDALDRGGGRVAIYEIGPREQVQQVSTVARNANSLALAVSIAASVPGSGVGANAAAGFSRQAIGRAAALERVPAVVGYSLLSNRTFGWVIGPRATVNAKGSIDLEQSLRPFDLSVDLSVPSWWPAFYIEATTGWAPKARDIVAGNIASQGAPSDGARNGSRLVRVEMSPNDADFAALTSHLSNGSAGERRRASLADAQLTGQAASACRSTAIVVRGESLWRATTALVGGYRLGASAITVLPDMSGVLLDVPAMGVLLGEVAGAKIPLKVLTPYGEADGWIDYAPKSSADCKDLQAAGADGPSVSLIDPVQITVPAPLDFRVTGKKLEQIDAATLNGQSGKVTVAKGGASLIVSFTAEQTIGLPVSRTVPLTFFKEGAKVAEKTVEVTANLGGK